MSDNFQYFDKADLILANGQNNLVLIDNERNSKTPIRFHSITIRENDLSKWIVIVSQDVGCGFHFRNTFDTKESAQAFADSILAKVNFVVV